MQKARGYRLWHRWDDGIRASRQGTPGPSSEQFTFEEYHPVLSWLAGIAVAEDAE